MFTAWSLFARRASLALLAAALLAAQAGGPAAYGQAATATLSGTVEDEKGDRVADASVMVSNPATGLERHVTTTGDGAFTIPQLPPGTYLVRVEREGFAPVEARDVVLNVGDRRALLIQLRVAQIGETVTITDASTVSEDPAVATVVDRQFVENLPLNGRSFQSLITLAPGTVLTKTDLNEQGQFSVNGQRANANYFTVDGVSANIGVVAAVPQGQAGGGTLPGLSTLGGTNNLISVDALQEFRIVTSTYAPEYGRTPGAQVSIVTRSGTNAFTGTVFEYFRNEALDANDWFNNAAGLDKPALRQNDFGGVIGGPIVRDRTFFFFSYEGLRLRLPRTATTLVPSAEARAAAGPAIRPFLDAFPLPTGPDLGNGLAESTASFSNPSSLDATSVRVDHNFSDRLTLFGRYNYSPSETEERGVAASGNSLNSVTESRITTQTLTGGATFTLTPSIVNELRVNYSRNRGSGRFVLDDLGGAAVPPDSVLFPSAAPAGTSAFVFFLGGSVFTVGKIADNLQRQVNLVDNVAVVAGSHALKFGVDYRRLFPVLDPLAYTAVAFFGDVPSALSGVATFATVDATSGEIHPVFNNFSAYGQDTWKVTPRFTLTYGLRWELNPPPTEANGNDPPVLLGIDDPATFALAPFGTRLYETTYGNFAPRVGAAYQLSQRPGRETVVRGGFGVFYDLGTGQTSNAFIGFPYVASKFLVGVPFPLVPADAAPPPFTLEPPFGDIVAFDPKLELPRTYQFNVTVEQSLGADQTVSAAYVAAVGRRLLRQEQLLAPAPDFTLVDVVRNAATSDYHALQLQFTRRLSHGLQALASYTWSHSIDVASTDSGLNASVGFSDPNNDRGDSDFDVRHAFSAAVTYDVPVPNWNPVADAILHDWSIDTIVTARSATPVDLVAGFGFGPFFSFTRPDLVPGQPLYLDDPDAPGGRRFNPAAFAAPPPGRQGTLGRNVLRGHPVNQVDLALRREFDLTERVRLQFRAEFFNILNHPNFGDPGAGEFLGSKFLFDPRFGRSTSMLGRSLGSGGVNGGFNPLYQVGGPRSIQFALKLLF
jgi:hypothetical protein